MTPEGLVRRFDILAAVFSYLDLMRQEGVPSFLASELGVMLELGWRFQVRPKAWTR